MSKALNDFLALRQASIASSPTMQDQSSSSSEARQASPDNPCVSGHEVIHSGELPAELNATALTAYLADLLAAHPDVESVMDRLGLAEYLSRAILVRYGNPEQWTWNTEGPFVRAQKKDGASSWSAQCPAGHLTDEAIESRQVLGWACDQCQCVYDPRECSPVRRGHSSSGQPANPANIGLE